jgi:hypothetical protein
MNNISLFGPFYLALMIGPHVFHLKTWTVLPMLILSFIMLRLLCRLIFMRLQVRKA